MILLQQQVTAIIDVPHSLLVEEVSLKIKKALPNSKDTQQWPVPPDAPRDIPRLIIQYEDRRISFSNARLDIFSETDGVAFDTIMTIYPLLKELGISFQALAAINTRFYECTLKNISKLLKPEISNILPTEVTVRVNVPFEESGITYNRIEQIASGQIEEIKTKSVLTGAIITVDTNTLATKQKNIDTETARKIYATIRKNIENEFLIKEATNGA